MESFTPVSAIVGGALIGVAASILLLFHGRIAGISGILAETLRGRVRGEDSYRVAFLGGLALAGIAMRVLTPSVFGEGGAAGLGIVPVAIAGLVVGYGTRLGNGCTSGHGVCGMSRLSKRSIVATITFMAAGGVTVFMVRHVLRLQLGGTP